VGERIEFTRNYSDLSTNQGFQFEFFCNRCSTGYRTRFKPSITGTLTGAMGAASSLFGGIRTAGPRFRPRRTARGAAQRWRLMPNAAPSAGRR
jgi:hypothetical protein